MLGGGQGMGQEEAGWGWSRWWEELEWEGPGAELGKSVPVVIIRMELEHFFQSSVTQLKWS